LEHWQVISLFLVVYDLIAVNFSYFAALWLRFDCRFSTIDSTYLQAWMKFVPIYSVVCLVIFYILKLYQSLWRFASYTELVRTAGGSLLAAAIHTVAITVLFHRMPISYYFVGAGLQFAFVIGIRFGYRLILLERTRQGRNAVAANGRPSRVMLIGAGAAGQMILRDMHCSPSLKQRVCCIIDDNPNKWNRYIDGVPIVGGREDILSCVKKYRIDKIYLAIPSADAATRRDILDICKETGCELKNLPGIYQFVLGEIKVGAMKDVAVEDLLGRDPIQVNMDEIFNYIKGKVVLVTGGGGSIGSELCRQIAGHNPKQLIIFDIYENNAYSIQVELKDRYPNLNLEVLIGSVRDSRKVNQLFAKYHPDVVYHAAAHKHVPLMEDSPCEAIKNNVVGTYKVAYAAMHNHCQRFVLISTDKAVNPTNIMGASKRLCEMVIQLFDQMIKAGQAAEIPALSLHEEGETLPLEGEAKTEFVAVRFGNVLGSNGSVIPLFKKQIANGGPVTVTHPDIIRYFMTIPEAVSLVLQAGTYAKGGEIFILDMGAPVKIDTLARNLIKLSGLKPDVDIMIEYTGLRPGEKLYEEKLMAEEGMRTTPNHLIHIGQPMTFDENLLLRQLEMLMEAAYDGREDIRDLVEQVVPTYHPAENSVRSENLVEKETACLTQTV
jgi:FlaA1/EpsC-like NDP-sugar epimerase